MLMSLLTQRNAPSITQSVFTLKSEYDVIIVGAGAAGATLAGRLSELPCINVLLLEAGHGAPLLSDIPVYGFSFWYSDIDWAYRTVPQKYTARLIENRQIVWPSGKGFGGSSLINNGLYVRGNRKNYDDWETKYGAKGWSYKDVLPYFKKMEDNRNPDFFADGYHGVGGPLSVEKPNYNPEYKAKVVEVIKKMGYKFVDPNGETQTGFYDVQGDLRNNQRCSTAKSYLVPAQFRRNLHIVPDALVTKVNIENHRAVGVFVEINGTTYQIRAKKEVIVSAGTVNTAQILMLSGIGPKKELDKHGIQMIADLPVGENFHDQISTLNNFVLGPNHTPAAKKISDPKNIKDYLHHRKGPLGSLEFVTIMGWLNSGKMDSKIDDPNYQLYFLETPPGGIQALKMLPSAYEQIFGPYQNVPILTCFSQLVKISSKGTVTLNSSDPHDQPLIDPNYFSDPSDLQDMIEGMKMCRKIGESEPMKKIGIHLFNTTYPGCEQYVGAENEYLKCMAM
ncbi:glucose dehydrogenase [FAD, quinone]-like [Parasteatoda tepidariorum]|uniref:glucose dehydrogenase [FAD, quinone]-like n=1 Tax=Parasteatoda tepidariorum TaxID=114398 RepID=UPI0039BCC993